VSISRSGRRGSMPVYRSKDQYEKLLKEHIEQLSSQQELLYASNRPRRPADLPGDGRGRKDGAIKHVMSGVNPQGCQVFSFKHPSASELEHDFLWRTTRDLPERGRIGIFNRSYYEEVLIVRRASRDFSSARGSPERHGTTTRRSGAIGIGSINESVYELRRQQNSHSGFCYSTSLRTKQRKRFLGRHR